MMSLLSTPLSVYLLVKKELSMSEEPLVQRTVGSGIPNATQSNVTVEPVGGVVSGGRGLN